MTINLQTLKCGECGSGVLQRSGLNQYTCAHCGSVSIVEDKISERLERVLEQVKDEAGRRLAEEHSARQRHVGKAMAVAAASIVVLATGVFLVTAFLVDRKEPAVAGRPAGRRDGAAHDPDRGPQARPAAPGAGGQWQLGAAQAAGDGAQRNRQRARAAERQGSLLRR